jgi:hypothetical protein
VTISTVKQVLSDFVAECDQTTDLVHTISDTRQMIGIPPNVLGTMQLHPNPLTHPKAGSHVVVMSNGLLRVLIQTLAGLVPNSRFHCVRTLDEAWAIIHEVLPEETLSS